MIKRKNKIPEGQISDNNYHVFYLDENTLLAPLAFSRIILESFRNLSFIKLFKLYEFFYLKGKLYQDIMNFPLQCVDIFLKFFTM